MATIVLGIGTSHSTQCSLTPDWWAEQGNFDRRRTPFDELARNAPSWLPAELTMETWTRKYEDIQRSITALSDALDQARPDVLVIFGDDQRELFLDDTIPMFSVFRGEQIWDLPGSTEKLSPSHKAGRWAIHGDAPEAYPAAPELANHIVSALVEAEFDVSQFTRQPEGRSLGHAWTFIRRRLMRGAPIPMVPVMINTYFPPNQPSARRCYALGQAVRRAVESWPKDCKVGIVASGGLSHFVVDEALDRFVIDSMARKDAAALSGIPREKLQSGSSEILNWIAAAGALEGLSMYLISYVPGYRSVAATGCGMTFVRWS